MIELEHRKSLIKSLSSPRFSRYSIDAKNDEDRAVSLYLWNSKLSQSIYIYLQSWEICFRNRVNEFLIWKYKSDWAYDERRFIRNLNRTDKERLKEARERQEKQRERSPAPLPAIVADLSLGFWVSQISKAYDVPHVWRYNLAHVFPNDAALNQRSAWKISDELLTLRNRVAHHEPIYHLNLEQHHRDLQRITMAMCSGTHAFAELSCNFRDVLKFRP